ncbi:hypothetical protein IDSA_07775 [Pseudidiomarina salinarum]|uniref:Glucose/Sorbosone dehydrogenase domain-containing protein n=1 Tax=Pseudidiomarina salinarum TaxID=435908 RepID=A0A094ITF6_9GAMM|nr:PQQ-dependent sugar dehydrogenase [Pseudidiomarina salinarum]KFZ30960.1 hypothetical protein IDSA_07775 [Pseudidiomarina salinarum]RUO71447.1 PQQ-dependent sugar dehydrogenase [Pseudidiomarina salinarum]
MKTVVTAALLSLLTVLPGHAQVAENNYQAEEVVTGLHYPWSIASLPEGGWLVTERSGGLKHVTAAGVVTAVAAEFPDLYVESQAGLFELQLTPDFDNTRAVVVSYACGTGDANNTCVVRGIIPEDRPYRLTDLQMIFTAQPKKAGASHYGGRMTWLADGTLLIGLGDGFDYREQAQNLDNHLGTIVRIHADGRVPDDNPYLHKQAPEIYSYGHRNVQGLVYDPVRDAVWQHEHGPRGGDELNKIIAGKNYGWPLVSYGIDYSGARVTPFDDLPGLVSPLYHWTPSLAPAGLALYSGHALEGWHGDLLVAHLVGRRLQRFSQDASGEWQLTEELLNEYGARLRAVHVGRDGAVYVLTDSDNAALLRITQKGTD